MLFLGYIDESDTHGPEPDMVMTAMLASGRQWVQIRRQLRELQSLYQFTTFHGSEFKSQTGDFRGWSEWKCRGLLSDFGQILSGRLTECITTTLRYRDYKENFLEILPPKMHRTSQYGLCFLALLDYCIFYVREHGHHHKLSLIVESGHNNARDTARLFREHGTILKGGGLDILRSYTLASKDDNPLLMLADVSAYGMAQRERDRRFNPEKFVETPKLPAPQPGQTGWTRADITPEYLRRQIDLFHQDRQAKMDEYLKRKIAWLSLKNEK
ncbi:MAG: DUF3800 domain-containing protein [Alphaproteobacteria bacterium]|nr:DUF3800 domain-containing protein [Alphaproteobacteria bacterium]